MRLSVRKGDRASLICEASGDRPMDISWRRNGIPISPDEDARSVIDFCFLVLLLSKIFIPLSTAYTTTV